MQVRMASTRVVASALSSLPVFTKGDSFARWQTSLARRRPRPAMAMLVAQEPVEAHRVLVQEGQQGERIELVGLRAESSSGLL